LLRRYFHPGGPPQDVAVKFRGSRIPPRRLLPWFVAGFAVLSVAGWWWLARRGPAAPYIVPGSSAVELADRIAVLDLANASEKAELDAGRLAAYHRERAELKAALDAALARGRRRT
jgi:hypothetical protein